MASDLIWNQFFTQQIKEKATEPSRQPEQRREGMGRMLGWGKQWVGWKHWVLRNQAQQENGYRGAPDKQTGPGDTCLPAMY